MSNQQENKYISFHRERQEPIDKYTRAEADEKLDALVKQFKEMLVASEKKIKDFYIVEQKKLIDALSERLANMDKKIIGLVSREDFERSINNMKTDISNLKIHLNELIDLHNSVADTVDKYMSKKHWWNK